MMQTRISELVQLTSVPNWDDEGGAVIDRREWDAARQFAEVVAAEVPGAPLAFFSACGDGTIHMRWASASASVDAEIDGDTYHWVIRTSEGRKRYESPRASELIQAVRLVFG